MIIKFYKTLWMISMIYLISRESCVEQELERDRKPIDSHPASQIAYDRTSLILLYYCDKKLALIDNGCSILKAWIIVEVKSHPYHE